MALIHGTGGKNSNSGARKAYNGSGGTTAYYLNQVWDTVASTFVNWITTGASDPGGVSYPGPGVYGADTSNYVLVKKW